MKVNIYSEDIYLKKSLNELVAFTSFAHMSCAGKIVIIDLPTFNEFSVEGLARLNICHMILLSEIPCIQEWLGVKKIDFDIHVISRKATLKQFHKELGEIFTKIRMRKCFWAYTGEPKNNYKAALWRTSPREKEVLKYYLKRFNTRDIATNVGISTKSVSAYKNSAIKKMKLSGNVFRLTRGIQQIAMLEQLVKLRNDYLAHEPIRPKKCDMVLLQDSLR